MSLLTHNEALAYLRGKPLPRDFNQRLRNQLEFDACRNCDYRLRGPIRGGDNNAFEGVLIPVRWLTQPWADSEAA